MVSGCGSARCSSIKGQALPEPFIGSAPPVGTVPVRFAFANLRFRSPPGRRLRRPAVSDQRFAAGPRPGSAGCARPPCGLFFRFFYSGRLRNAFFSLHSYTSPPPGSSTAIDKPPPPNPENSASTARTHDPRYTQSGQSPEPSAATPVCHSTPPGESPHPNSPDAPPAPPHPITPPHDPPDNPVAPSTAAPAQTRKSPPSAAKTHSAAAHSTPHGATKHPPAANPIAKTSHPGGNSPQTIASTHHPYPKCTPETIVFPLLEPKKLTAPHKESIFQRTHKGITLCSTKSTTPASKAK